MAFKGTARRSAREIAEAIENVGGDINAATSTEATSYTARVLGEDAGLALDVIGDILTRATFGSVESVAAAVESLLAGRGAAAGRREDGGASRGGAKGLA